MLYKYLCHQGQCKVSFYSMGARVKLFHNRKISIRKSHFNLHTDLSGCYENLKTDEMSYVCP